MHTSSGWITSPLNAFIHQMLIVVLLVSSSKIWKESGLQPRAILDIIKSGENFRISTTTKMPEQGTCERCGYISSQKWCKACVLLEGLNRGLPKMGIGRNRGVNNNQKKDMKQSNGAKNIESKQCGTLDF
ncbi:putative tRNA sulfurtransferase [Rosa chinensis]|uniref:Putative tRNA sulfurtransferase n=1 Tax=Rosa chinensis TaxID=74649 RepID=A0A2P6PZH8_ROSCH|nr:putative tRNA sulfurtransferase [Rosa chinensis]